MPQSDDFLIKACILSLASNYNQKHYLEKAENWLQAFGGLMLSVINTNKDKNIQQNEQIDADIAELIYFNQIAYLEFKQAINYFEWLQITKDFEQQQDRQQYRKPLVSLDIDIVAIKLVEDILSSNNLQDEKNQNFILLNNTKASSLWLGINRRFPLACYDQKGIEDLSQKIDLSFINNF